MKRRMALTFAGTAAIVLTAGSAAVAANLGILGSANQEPVGQLDANSVADLSAATTTSVEHIVVTVDEIIPVPVETPTTVAPPVVAGPSTGSGTSSGSGGTDQAPAATPTTAPRVDNSGPGSIDDDHGDDEEDDHSGTGGGEDDDEYDDD
jgi:hypothetical protein